ncbi:MAG: low molecular weight protein-tyrosine-phosphatase [Jatrophihabitans sp.]|uniref:low molecular weight protein-tyrosine-phosphatase n=1 Tax=Jatrophihabitans sp. TaxID=1932789 RepID=UPI003F80D7DB
MRICFVCSGNICRSPTAEVVLTALVEAEGLDVEIDSAGTGGWHAGEDMDDRSRRTLEGAGYTPARHTAKQFTPADFAARDLVVALDLGHLRELRRLADRTADPAASRAKLVLLRSFDPTADPNDLDVPDPYYGGPDGFTEVLAQVERAADGLLASLRQQTESPPP